MKTIPATSRPTEHEAASDHAGLQVEDLSARVLKGRGWTALRLFIDLTLLLLAVAAAETGADAAELDDDGRMLTWFLPPLVLGLFALNGLYRGEFRVRLVDGLGKVVGATSLAAIALIAVDAYLEPGNRPALMIARAWLYATVYLIGGRLLLTWAQNRARSNLLVGKPTLVVGAGQIGAQVERRLSEQPELGFRVVGYVDADPPPEEMVPSREAPVVGGPDDLPELLDRTGAQHVVLAFTSSPDSVLLPLIGQCEDRGVEVSLVPRLFESINVRVDVEHIGGLPLLGLHSVNPKGWQFDVKHGLDRSIAAALLLILAPLMVAITLAVRLTSSGPILFRQRRVGRDGRAFDMLKFRSMRVVGSATTQRDDLAEVLENEAPGGVEGDDRRTAVGKLIRRTSLDELPQLVNVLKGDMSLVGPRPERPEFAELFGRNVRRYQDRHRVKSGITGWAQVNGLRGRTSLADRVEWDNYYIENWSLTLDLKILVMTLAAPFYEAE
jgi:exopolysaccharide biosynthesis polyprenyl glycosylphosphotransferase